VSGEKEAVSGGAEVSTAPGPLTSSDAWAWKDAWIAIILRTYVRGIEDNPDVVNDMVPNSDVESVR